MFGSIGGVNIYNNMVSKPNYTTNAVKFGSSSSSSSSGNINGGLEADTFTKSDQSSKKFKDFTVPTMESLYGLGDSLVNNKIRGVVKAGGPATELAKAIGSKAASLVHSCVAEIQSMNQELNECAIKGRFSQEELNKKQDEILKKIEIYKKEVEVKLQVLSILADKLPGLNTELSCMKEKNIPSDELTGFFAETLKNVETSPSNITSSDDKNSINDKILKSALGQNSKEKFDKKRSDIKAKIQEIDEKLNKNAESGEKENLAAQREALVLQLGVVEEIKQSFCSDKKIV